MNSLKHYDFFYALSLITSNLLFGFIPVLQKFTFSYGGNGLLTALYSSIISLIPLFILAHHFNISLKPDIATAKKLFFLCICSVCTILFLWSSYSYIPVGIATTLHYIYPIIIALTMTIVYHEPFSIRSLISLSLVIIGVCLTSISHEADIKPIGFFLAVISGFFWAFYIVYIEKSGLCHKPAYLINFYTTFANIPFIFIICVLSNSFILFHAPIPWLIIISVAFLHRICAYGLLQLGLRHIKPFSAGILCTFEPLSSILFGRLFFKEIITPIQTLGLFLILLGIFFNLYANKS